MTEETKKPPEKSEDQIREEEKEELELLRAQLKSELGDIRKNRIFSSLLKLVDRKKNDHLSIDKIKPDKDAAAQYYFCKGVVDLARKIEGFIKDIENGRISFRVWSETEEGRDE